LRTKRNSVDKYNLSGLYQFVHVDIWGRQDRHSKSYLKNIYLNKI
jgi:hypothetical protein